MKAHKFVDALNHVKDAPRLLIMDRSLPRVESIYAGLILASEKFEFGNLFSKPEEGKELDVPMLTPEEYELWIKNEIVVPSPTCWYEFQIQDETVGLLVSDTGEQLIVKRFSYTNKHNVESVNMVPVRYGRQKNGTGDTLIFFDGRTPAEQQFSATVWEKVKKLAAENSFDMDTQYGAMSIRLALYLTGRISKPSPRTFNMAPEKLNKKRMNAGKSPLFAHQFIDLAQTTGAAG